MAESKEYSGTKTSQKGKSNVIPVTPCKGWSDACDYCDKRFTKWITVDDEILEKVPEKPGILELALKNKNATEIVIIFLEPTNMQNIVYDKIENLRVQISDKKTKASKSDILIRWHMFKDISDRESCILYAHWINLGVMPKYMKKWLGENYLQKCSELMFSENEQLWCYPHKDPTWRKPKTDLALEVVPKCEWDSECEFCNSYFTPWKSFHEVFEQKDKLSDVKGILLHSKKHGNKREIVKLDTALNDKEGSICNLLNWIYCDVGKKTRDPKTIHDIRWVEIKNVNSENSCLIYAHFLNADKMPPKTSENLSLETFLLQNQDFEFNTKIKKWCSKLMMAKSKKKSKSKTRKELWDEIDEDINLITLTK